MVIRRRGRAHAEQLQAIREHLARCDAALSSAVSDIATAFEARLRRHEDTASRLGAVVDGLRLQLSERDARLLSATEDLRATHELVAGWVAEQREEQRALVDAVTGFVRSISDQANPLALGRATARVVGGTLDARRVEVRCRFGGRWVGGFEIADVVLSDDTVRYRLRRCSDGSVLPTLFDPDDVRRSDVASPTDDAPHTWRRA